MPVGSDRQALVNSDGAPALSLTRSSIRRARSRSYPRLKRFRLESARRPSRSIAHSIALSSVLSVVPSCAGERVLVDSSRAADERRVARSCWSRASPRAAIAARATCAARDGGMRPCAAGAERGSARRARLPVRCDSSHESCGRSIVRHPSDRAPSSAADAALADDDEGARRRFAPRARPEQHSALAFLREPTKLVS
jgi:hypothetical protein